ncbi:hypothetical protein KKG45_00725 [bacterium]|nr:hypothetical protein [bacterium]MBU1071749.1 hypothetical protein [bacterium]MBU1676583.1 hypothetical protein [bacterium]
MFGKSHPVVFLLFMILVPLLAAPATGAEEHASTLPVLTRDGPYPRISPEQLAESGFPDHKHAFFWPDWEPLRDEDGKPYGMGSVCKGMVWQDRADVISESGLMILGLVKLEYHAGNKRCVVAPFVEICEMALRDVSDLLDLTATDTLRIVNTNMIDAYTSRTGQGTWRMYKRAGDLCIVQPIPILVARTLAGHAAYDLVAAWLLDENGCDALPPWLRQGLAAYVAEMGTHLNNYMLQFRAEGDILLTPAETDELFSAPPLSDSAQDRKMFRMARYAAFLMAWRLIEERGGMASMRAFLSAVRDGRDPDEACAEIYGTDLYALATALDPTVLGEPQGESFQTRRPHIPLAPTAGE